MAVLVREFEREPGADAEGCPLVDESWARELGMWCECPKNGIMVYLAFTIGDPGIGSM